MPFEQHFLVGAIAPRRVAIGSAREDEWADPDAELLACQLASPAFELYGLKGLVMEDDSPILNKAYKDGHIAFHVKEGDHSQLQFDWDNLMDYFDKIIEETSVN
jgi:hypothetical protein